VDATHARPMTAYAALCAVAAVVLAQGVSPSSPGIADAIARAGGPAQMVAPAVTMSASAHVAGVGKRVAEAVVPVIVPVIAVVAPATREIASHAEAAGVTVDSDKGRNGSSAQASADASTHTTKTVGEPVTVAAAPTRVLERSHVLSPAQRERAREDRKADRAEQKADRKAQRATERAERRAARAQRQR
jgi:hypothetical protein